MSGFFKGIFGEKDEAEQSAEAVMANAELETRTHDEQELGDFHADVRGTIDTEVEAAAEPEPVVEPEPTPTVAEAAGVPHLTEFDAERVWNQAGVGTHDQSTVRKAQHLLGSLPGSTPDEVKRQIVEASLQAFDVSIAEIIASASGEIDALRDYISETNESAEHFSSTSESRIEELEAEIAAIRASMQDSDSERERLVAAATGVINEVEPVLGFFGTAQQKSFEAKAMAATSMDDEVNDNSSNDEL